MKRLVPLSLLLVTSACPRPSPAPLQASASVAGLDVNVDATTNTLLVRSGSRTVAQLELGRVGVRHADASFEMEFGMFDVREYPGEWTQGMVAAAPRVDGDRVLFELRQGATVAAHGEVSSVAQGHLRLRITATDPAHNRARVAWDCRADEHFNGFGSQTHDVDHRGQRIPLWVSEQGIGKLDTDDLPDLWQVVGRRHTTHVPIPAMVSSRGAAFLLETYAYSVFDVCAESAAHVSAEAWEGEVRLHIVDGPSPLEALGRMSAWLGRPPLPAPYVFAPWNDAIFGDANVRRFAQVLADNAIPSSVIWTEDWKGGDMDGELYTLSEDWHVDTTLYPDLPGLTADLRAQGIVMQLYRNPFMYLSADVYAEAVSGRHVVMDINDEPWVSTGAKFTDTAYLDLSTEPSRAWVKTLLAEALQLGARGWMTDFAEWMPVDGAVLGSGEDPALVHNRYPVLWAQTNREAVLESGLQDEVILFNRSGHIGSQRVVQVMWAGDQRTSFMPDDGFPTVIPIGIGLAATGFFFFAHDVGGYQSGTNPPATRELFFRWTELGAFSPVMRTHHGTHPRRQWNIESDAGTTAHWKRYAELHIRLYPYLRRLGMDAVERGVPIWIPLGLQFPTDATAWAIKDEVLLGRALLVAPVSVEGATSRDVYLPEGRWAPAFTAGTVHSGPASVTVPAPLEEIPVFVAAGGIVPMTATAARTLLENVPGLAGLESTRGDREVIVGMGADGEFTEEDGSTWRITGAGTATGGITLDAQGRACFTGNATLTGDGFTFTAEQQPSGRNTCVVFR